MHWPVRSPGAAACSRACSNASKGTGARAGFPAHPAAVGACRSARVPVLPVARLDRSFVVFSSSACTRARAVGTAPTHESARQVGGARSAASAGSISASWPTQSWRAASRSASDAGRRSRYPDSRSRRDAAARWRPHGLAMLADHQLHAAGAIPPAAWASCWLSAAARRRSSVSMRCCPPPVAEENLSQRGQFLKFRRTLGGQRQVGDDSG